MVRFPSFSFEFFAVEIHRFAFFEFAGTLANVIRQLSSLSAYAEDLFGGLVSETSIMIKRANTLQARVDKLAQKVTELDSTVEEVSLHEINQHRPFKANCSYDQEVLSRQTMPPSIMEKYSQCDRPPPLDKLNTFRDDGKDAMKFYTDPNYFFELWKAEMLKMSEKEKSGKRIANRNAAVSTKQIEESHFNKHNKKPRQPENTTEKYRKMVPQQEFLIDQNTNHVPFQTLQSDNPYSSYGTIRPNSINSIQSGNYSVNYNSTELHGTLGANNPYQRTSLQQQQFQPQQPYVSSTPTVNGTSSYGPHSVYNNGAPAVHPSMHHATPPDQVQYRHMVQSQTNVSPPSSTATLTPSKKIGPRPSQPPPAPPPPGSAISPTQTPNRFSDSLPLPPPPPPMPPMPSANSAALVPPPPPPPMPAMSSLDQTDKGSSSRNSLASNRSSGSSQPRPTNLAQEILLKQQQLKPATTQPFQRPLVDPRNDLLASIREGIKLRSVQSNKEKQVEKENPLHDVASILARRVAMQLSDSDSNHSENETDDGWDEDSHH